jgi:hypothetical protein
MEIGEDDGGLIAEGWNPPELRAGRWVRVTRRKQTRLFVPLERTDVYRLTFQLSVRPQPVEVIVRINEREAGRFLATPESAEYSLLVPEYWRKGPNTLSVEPQFQQAGQILLLDSVTFERSSTYP